MADTPPGTRLLRGHLQLVQPFKLRGWAYMPTRPDDHVRVEVRLDGALIEQGLASAHFADLEKHKIGGGDHGFMFNLRHELPLDAPHRIEVIAIGPDGQRLVLEKPEPRPEKMRAAPPADLPDVVVAPGGLTLADRAQRPVFVLGSARSGTTAMMLALKQSGRYEGYNEGHLLGLIGKLHALVTNHYAKSAKDAAPGMNTAIAHVPIGLINGALRHAFIEVIRATYPTGFWLDKTPGPEMIRTVPILLRIWPESRFVFMKRRPVDNIESRRRKFPSIAFKDHCQLWADSMMAWHAVRDLLGDAQLEVDQVRLAREPDAVADELAGLLDLTAGQRARALHSLKTDLPQRTSARFAPTQEIETVDWTAQQRATFREICAEPMARFGYV